MKRLTCMLLVLALTLSCFGVVALAEEKITLKVAISGDNSEIALREETADLFLAEHPNITIEWIDLGSTQTRVTKTLAMIAAREAPDVLYLNTVVVYAQKGALEPLTEYVAAEGDDFLDYYFDSALDPLTIDGVLYALPQELSPSVIYYNADIFDRYGVAKPYDGWTWDEFIEACYKIAEAGQAENIYPISCVSTGTAVMRMLQFMNVYAYDKDGKFVFHEEDQREKAIEALAALQKLVYEDKVIPNPAEVEAMGSAFNAAFFNGQVAMQMAGMYYLPTYKLEEPEFNWDVAYVPTSVDGTMLTSAATLNWGIWEGSQHKQEAWEFLKFFTGHEGNMIVGKYNMAMPAAHDDEANQQIIDSKFPENVKAFIESAEFVIAPDAKSLVQTEVRNIFFAECSNLMLGDITPEEAYDAICEQCLEALEDIQ